MAGTGFAQRFGDVKPGGMSALEIAKKTGGLSLGVDCVEWWSEDALDERRFCERIALRVGKGGIPFLTAIDDRALALTSGPFSPPEFRSLASAVTRGHVSLEPRSFLHASYPVLGLLFSIEDDPADPFRTEAVVDIANANAQVFLAAVHEAGSGGFHLVLDNELQLSEKHAVGRFALRGEPSRARAALGETIRRMASHLLAIPEAERDFAAATRTYLRTT